MGPLLISLPESVLHGLALLVSSAGLDLHAMGPYADSLALLLVGAALVACSVWLRRIKASPARSRPERVPAAHSGETVSPEFTTTHEPVAR